jgi:hypothetical protein
MRSTRRVPSKPSRKQKSPRIKGNYLEAQNIPEPTEQRLGRDLQSKMQQSPII